MEEILNSISSAGIKTDPEKQANITALPSYKGNFGFYHVKGEDWETVIIKGVFKDNLRNVKGKCMIPDRKMNELAQTLSDVERCLRKPASVQICFTDDSFFVCAAEEGSYTKLADDARDFSIRFPLTPVEESLGRSSSISEKHLFSRSPFFSVFGEILSPYAYSLFEAMPDVFSPLFMSADIKTHSPSVKTIFGRVLMNSANVETIMSAFYTKPDFFYLNYLPSIYKSIKKPVLDVPKISVLKLAPDELNNTIEDIDRVTNSLDEAALFDNEFLEVPMLGVMAWEIAVINIWHAFTEFAKATGLGHEDVMRHIYKTRKGGLLRYEGEIMPRLDPACEPVVLEPLEIPSEDADGFYGSLSSMKRLMFSKVKYTALLDHAHKALDDADRVYLSLSGLASKMRSVLLSTADRLVENRMLTDRNDIFLLEHKEIQNLINDSFYGNITFTLNFRRWQGSRFASVCLPAYLYEKDVENYKDIAEKQMGKSLNDKTIPCLAFFHRPTETANFACRYGFSIADVKEAVKADVVVAESASVFSYIAQYCTIADKPLYTGARFAPLLVRDKKLKTGTDSLTII